MLMYCKKCGRTWRKDFDYESDDCDICGSTCYPVPDKYLLCFDGEIEKDLLDNEKEEQFMEECVKTSPEFDEELFNARDGILAKKQARWEEESRIGQAIMDGADPELAFRNEGGNLPKCPACGSMKVRKISGAKRWLSTGLFGLGSSNVAKTMECKNCGYKF